MKSKMIGLFAVLMIALMAVGFAYALWDATLLINGNVETGDVNAGFNSLSISCEDNEEGLDVGTCSVSWPALWGSKTLEVTIDNAYPSYICWVEFTIDDLGTVPGKIASVNIVGNLGVLDVKLTSLSPGGPLPYTDKVAIHVNDNAAEGASYSFTITFEVVAFNVD